ncbi:ABC transporter related protein [Ruminiclostridium papyrosolvens DSM 2782]|uniref:UvrABC system protein A n=3 Tax=Ruminiclostridium papyrosolvens TaxID=29362 RepID=F1T856_9FIRM|nr:ABC transporter related protein [Ruminiclostridium papyrosolvens DSM 2782]
MNDFIEIKNARIHNLKGVDIKIPKNKLTVITGVSGSGKSSLAFDTLYEEGKRRYLMFSGTQFMIDSTPTFDSITGLSPTVAVEQRIIRQSNPRSTVGTRTKISNILAMLFAAYGTSDSSFNDGLPLSMEMFQKNSPKGMCVKCLGSGIVKKVDEGKLFGNLSLKVEDVCLGVGKRGSTKKLLDSFYKHHNISPSQELSSLSEEQLFSLKYGDGGKSSFMGFIPWIFHVTNGAFSTNSRLSYLLTEAGYMTNSSCPKCGGTGLGVHASSTTIGGKTISELDSMYIKDLFEFLGSAPLKSSPLLNEIISKLSCMVDVGLHHLSLSRPVPTLSGGEIQRLFLASYIIAEMDSIIFVFDEPTIGLHEVEKEKLISIISNLVNRGNTVIAVEHDENFMRCADYIIDLGPLAGINGGERIFQGSFKEFLDCNSSNTSPYLRDNGLLNIKQIYRTVNSDKTLKIENANIHNLHNVNVTIPLGLMVGVAGVSGSGKSSLISDTLVPKLKTLLNDKFVGSEDEESEEISEDNSAITGWEQIKKCLVIDQKPIGRSRTSCPATYTGVFDRIRTLFAKESGMPSGLFTVNSEGGCKICKGDGEVHYHVGFGNFIDTQCDACSGTGFIPQALEVTLDGKNIRDILSLTVDEAVAFFKGKDNQIDKILATLQRVGMGYITLGQKTPTISGGESQRIKLAKELSKGQSAKDSVYVLDEPTTGLSFHDSVRLMKLMEELVEKGNTVIVTEHDPYILSNCDYIIEMGPGGGSDGGELIAADSPAALKNNQNSIIGRYLK